MIIYIFIIFCIFLMEVRLRKNSNTLLSIEDTTNVNGICTLLIFFSHSVQYWPLSNSNFDQAYQHVQNIHNQWVVAPFLAFSGYGVMSSIINKGSRYIKVYPSRRILKTLLNFDIAVVLYLLVAALTKSEYSIVEILGAFIGVTSVGNSNWYIFAILLMYIFSYIAAVLTDDFRKQFVLIVIFTSIYFVFMKLIGMGERFYSTIYCYSLGVFLAIYKDKILDIKKERKYIIICLMVFFLGITYKLRYNEFIMNMSSIVFVGLIVVLLCFFEFKGRFFYFWGKHAFSIFILQRIPAIVLTNFLQNRIDYFKYIYIIIDLLITVVIALVYDRCLNVIDTKTLKKYEDK